VQQLQQGKIDASQAAEMLNDVQSKLDEGNLDLGSINDGLEEIAKDLQSSDLTKAHSRCDDAETARPRR